MWGIIIVFCIWAGLGGNTVVLSGAMQRIPEDRFRKFFQVIFFLPNIISLVVLCMMVRHMFSSDFGPIALLIEKIAGHPIDWLGYQSNKFMTIGWYIFASVDTGGSGNMIQAATIGMLFSVLMLPFIIAVRLLVKKFTPDVQF